ncbi:cysteine desulfurase family protein [Egicoccus halophilus]|uniref:Aminotransferase n=1 Tax=Egicoccus halophilus TaxID=1670830 RepID=A0A8J3AEQ9_9ACTN|nr:cysteine desulfurase family protein [Egicoccus halophilus]GGI07237.1 aminotransferase [Egicoccus halophilus]
MNRIYLDHASAWPLRPEARQALADAATMAWADPTRGHQEGRAARDLLDRASATVAFALGADERDLVWTSGGTEAVHLAVLGSARAAERRGERRRHVVCSAVEHSSVLRACERLRTEHGYDLDVVGVDASGAVDPDAVAAVVRDDTLAVHVQHANHEIGTLQPTHELANACHRVGALLHVDACQTVGQLGVTLDQLGADLLSASGAKFGGPRGVGLLVLGPRGRIAALQEGDERQRRRRAGLEDVAGIAATAVALEVARAELQTAYSSREVVRRRLRERLPAAVEDLQVHGPLADAHPGIVAVSALYVDGEALVGELDRAGYAVHSGSSCASDSGRPSHVLVAMGVLTHGHVRLSFGPSFDLAQADAFVATYADTVRALRRRGGLG